MEKYLEGILERGERIGLTGAELRIWIQERIEETRELQALEKILFLLIRGCIVVQMNLIE